LGVDLEVIDKSGSWFSYNGNRLGQGRDAVKDLIKDNPELMEEIEAKIKNKVKGNDSALLDKEAVVEE
jgi:recombination protein RecA